MSAFAFEYEHAKQEGVRFLWHVQPVAIHGTESVESLRLTKLESSEDGSLVAQKDMEFLLAVDQVVLAIGQATHTDFLADAGLKIERGRIVIDRVTGQTSNPKYFAGGDCTNGGREVVDAVADGKRAALGIATWLGGKDADA
jgi:glutamate synthase (NADPH/NADH) small chain